MPCIRLLEVNANQTFVRAPPLFSELFPGLHLTSTYLPMTHFAGVAHTRFRLALCSPLFSYRCSSDEDDVDDKTVGVVRAQTGAV